jgi:Uma2 family endonuclease
MILIDTPLRETAKLYTYADYLKLPEDGIRYEILNGELIMSPAPTIGHQTTLRNFLVALSTFLEKNALGEVLPAPTDVILSDINVLQPDIVLVLREKYDIFTRENIQGAPDLVIEVLSRGTEKRDREEKLAQYSRFAVREYWMVHHEERWVEVWRRESGALAFYKRLGHNQILATPLLPGLKIKLAKIFFNRLK